MRLGDLLGPSTVSCGLGVSSREGLIEHLLDLIVESGALSADLRHDALARLISREKEMTTGIGQGIALPHARLPKLSLPVAALGTRPEGGHFVLIAAPHTSNWDLPLMLAFGWAFELDVRWLGKTSLFDGPAGWFYRWTGGLPVDRSKKTNLVDQAAAIFQAHERLTLVIAPEGTRRYVDYLKSGFYQIAQAADVPICPCFVDYKQKRSGVGPLVYPSGDATKDMDVIRAFYKDNAAARHPELTGRFRLPEEDQD